MEPTKEVLQIPIEHIIPNRFQPRLTFDETALKELAESIKSLGIIQPIVVRKLGNKYEIVAGERRFKAATLAGLTTVPVIVTEIDDKQSAEAALAENVQRKNLTPIEEAISYQNLLEKNRLTQEELAKKMGVSQATIANKIRLLSLSPKVQEALLKERITERHARSLLSYKEYNDQDRWLDKILKERLTVKQLDDLIKKDLVNEDEVPIIKTKPNVEDIINNTTDIVDGEQTENKIFNEEPVSKPSTDSINYFNDLENEPIFMNNNITSSSTPVFKEPSVFEESQSESTGLFDDVEFLDVDEDTITENNENIEEALDTNIYVEPEEKEVTSEFPDILEQVRNIPKQFKSTNIELEEIDLSSSYKIIITIPKE